MPRSFARIISVKARQEATALLHRCLGTDANLPPCDGRSIILGLQGYQLGTIAVATATVLPDGTGSLANAAVHPEFQGRGIGTDLVEARVNWLRSMGVTKAIVSEAWASRHGVNAAKPLVRNGFQLVRINEKGFAWCKDCPACRPNACECDAWIYELRK